MSPVGKSVSVEAKFKRNEDPDVQESCSVFFNGDSLNSHTLKATIVFHTESRLSLSPD